MNRDQLEKVYLANGLVDFQLRNLSDLLKVHGVDYRVKGHENLTNENRELYEKWLIKFFNRQGLGSRINLVPTRVYFCEEVCHLHSRENNFGKYFEDVKKELFEIRLNGSKKLVRAYKDKDNEGESIDKVTTLNYLRVEFKKKEWYHVYSLESWG